VLCSKDGQLLFTPDEVSALSKKSARVMARLWERTMKHNHLMADDVEELAKN
jgi:hypothetical protein